MSSELTLDPIDPLDSRKFVIAIKRLANGLNYGVDRSPYVGSGVEYAQSRPYQAGDPVKSIDWRVTARVQDVYVKEYEAPKQMPVYLLVDTSASMAVSSVPTSKYVRAVQLAGGLALACLERFSPVAVMGVGSRPLRYAPSLSRDRVLQWLHELRRYRVDERTLLARRLAELGPMLVQRSLVIVLSDLNDAAALSPLKELAQRHDCVAIQLRDPAEFDMRGAGFFRGREAETGAEFVSRGRRLGIDQDACERELKRGRVDHLVVRTDQPFFHRLRDFFESRGRIGRGAK